MLLLLSQSANDALAQEKERMDVLLARQYNLISCVLQQDETSKPKRSLEHRTLGELQHTCCHCLSRNSITAMLLTKFEAPHSG
jgi:hypothetical protein